jgi:hypothetical protein
LHDDNKYRGDANFIFWEHVFGTDGDLQIPELEHFSYFDFFRLKQELPIDRVKLLTIYSEYKKVMEPSNFEISSDKAKQRAVDIFEFLDVAYKNMSNDAKRAVHLLNYHLDFGHIDLERPPTEIWKLRDSFGLSVHIKEVNEIKSELNHWR